MRSELPTLAVVRDGKRKLELGSKFVGKAGFADTTAGVYWEVYPDMSDFDKRLQTALIEHRRREVREQKARELGIAPSRPWPRR